MSGYASPTAWQISFKIVDFPDPGGATIKPRCPIPIGVIKSIARTVSFSEPCSSRIPGVGLIATPFKKRFCGSASPSTSTIASASSAAGLASLFRFRVKPNVFLVMAVGLLLLDRYFLKCPLTIAACAPMEWSRRRNGKGAAVPCLHWLALIDACVYADNILL